LLIIGLDIGTTKIAGILRNTELDKTVDVISLDSGAAIESDREWEQIQRPDCILEKVMQITESLKKSAGEKVSGIGISSQMHGFLYINSEGKALSPLFTWQDLRAARPLAGGLSGIEEIKEKTGISISAGYGLATHYYNYINGLSPSGPYRIVSIGGYVAMTLSGCTKPSIDPSEGGGFGLYDTEKLCFYRHHIKDLFGTDDFLPEEVPFYSMAGSDSAGIPVFNSLGDNQSSFMGAMKGRDNDLLINLGTSGQICFLSDDIQAGLKGLETRPYPGKTLVVGATLAGGKSFALLMDLFHDVLSLFGRDMPHGDMMAVVDDLPFNVPANPLLVEPYFNGTRSNPDLRASVGNIDLTNLTARNLIYGFAHGMVNELKQLLVNNGLEDVIRGRSITASGNGIRKNPLVQRIVKTQFGSFPQLSVNKEEAACGAAFYVIDALSEV